MNRYLAFSIVVVLTIWSCADKAPAVKDPSPPVQNERTISKHKIGEKAEIEVIDLSDEVPLYVVIAGAYSATASAQKKVDILKKAGFTNAEVIKRPGSKLYSALVERFDSESSAKTFAEEIAANKEIKSFVYKLND